MRLGLQRFVQNGTNVNQFAIPQNFVINQDLFDGFEDAVNGQL